MLDGLSDSEVEEMTKMMETMGGPGGMPTPDEVEKQLAELKVLNMARGPRRCIAGALAVHCWCIAGALLVHCWCIPSVLIRKNW